MMLEINEGIPNLMPIELEVVRRIHVRIIVCT